jgi:predicted TIM-barrel fold metal-dependent hydrolase
MVIDDYNTVWTAGGTSDYLTGDDYPVERLLPAMDAAGVDMAVITGLGQMIDNDYIASCARKYPERVVAFAQINPRPPDAVEQLRALGATRQFRGVKLHPTCHGYHFADHGLLDPIFAACRDLGFVVLVNALDDPFCAPLSIEEIAKGFPEVPVIIAHMGTAWNTTEAILVAKRTPNLFLDTSSAELLAVSDAYETLGADQLLMGTDWPGSDFEIERLKMAKAIPDPEHRRQVEGENFARLVGIGVSE